MSDDASPNDAAGVDAVRGDARDQTTPGAARRTTGRRSFRPGRRAVVLIGIGMTLLAGLVVAIGGRVRGTEFSPTHFQTRRFSFYEIPFVHLQIGPVRRTAGTTPMEKLLRSKGWINVPAGKVTRWDIVRLRQGFGDGGIGDASLLTDALSLTRDGQSFWRTWSTDNPAAAAALWPRVQRLARRELYFFIPDVLAIAAAADDAAVDDMVADIDRRLRAGYVGLIRDLRRGPDPGLADPLIEEARGDYPDLQWAEP